MVLAVINQLSRADAVLKRAFEVAKDERVDILFVHEAPLFELEELLLDKESRFDKAKTKALLEEKVKRFSNQEVAILVQEGATADIIYDLLKEDKALIVSWYYQDIAKSFLRTVKQDILFLKADNVFKNAVLVVESLEGVKAALDFTKRFSPEVTLYYNFYYIPDVGVLDPSLEVDLQMSEFVLEEASKEFENLCNELGVKGRFFLNGVDNEEELSELINKEGFLLTAYKEDEDEFLLDSLASELLENVGSDFLLIRI